MSENHRKTSVRQWEKLRQRTFAEQGRRCQECGKAGMLEVHHKVELQHGGTNDASNLLVLCRGCHIEAHRPKAGEQEKAWQVEVGEIRTRSSDAYGIIPA